MSDKEGLADIIEWPLSAFADPSELEFREEREAYPEPERQLREWMARKKVREILWHALRQVRIRPAGVLLDLGAGSCWLSAELSRLPAVERIVSVAFSRRRLVLLAPLAAALLNAEAGKIQRVRGDFHALRLDESSVDYAFMDAALHHAADPVRVLSEVRRVLRPGGVLLAIREPTSALLRRIPPEQTQDGAFERVYTRRQYLALLQRAGLEPRAFCGYLRTSWKGHVKWYTPLRFANGLLFADFVYAGYKPAALPDAPAVRPAADTDSRISPV